MVAAVVNLTHPAVCSGLLADYVLLDVARYFEISVAQAQSLIQVQVGQVIAAGEAIALKLTELGKVQTLLAPCSGFVNSVLGGRVLVVAPRQPTLTAPRNVLLTAAWGSAVETSGILQVLPKMRTETLSASQVGRQAHIGQLLALSQTLTLPILEAALQAQVAGLVVAGVAANCLPALQACKLPVLVTEGFGEQVFCANSWVLLRNQMGTVLQIQSQPKPQLLLPNASNPQPVAPVELTVGSSVRAVRAPYLNQTGTITALWLNQALTNGVTATLAHVKLRSGVVVTIPSQNLASL
jgi:hypothetical protein